MENMFSFRNLLLIFLTITVLWLVFKVVDVAPDNSVYLRSTDGSFFVIKTVYAGFPTIIDEIKQIDDGTELSITLINPLNVHFADAEISIEVNGTTEKVRKDLAPSTNKLKLKIPPIMRGDPIKVSLLLDKVYFK